ncbi:RNA-directed DNA polymerase, eukaryota [Tanacetum coccineum]
MERCLYSYKGWMGLSLMDLSIGLGLTTYEFRIPNSPFVVNGHTYRKCYYLADDIYPAWSTVVKMFSVARDEKTLKFKRVQEAARKDIERAFRVLQEGSGEFSVASIRRFIDDQRLLTVDSKTLWIKSVPIKVNILAWKIKLEALPTRFNISRRVRQIARKICSWWDIEYSDVNSFTEWINWMASLRLQSKVKMMIQGVFFVVWWLVWSYRNKLLFEEKKPSKAIIFDDVVSISFYWCLGSCQAYGIPCEHGCGAIYFLHKEPEVIFPTGFEPTATDSNQVNPGMNNIIVSDSGTENRGRVVVGGVKVYNVRGCPTKKEDVVEASGGWCIRNGKTTREFAMGGKTATASGVRTRGGVMTKGGVRTIEVSRLEDNGGKVGAEKKIMIWYACERVGTESDGEGSEKRVEKGLGDGSKSSVYPHGIKSIGYVFHGIQLMKKQCQESDVKPEPVVRAQVVPSPILRRESERIKQIMFNKPPTPGPGLLLEDAMFIK